MERFASKSLTNANVLSCMLLAEQCNLQLLTSTTNKFIVRLVHRWSQSVTPIKLICIQRNYEEVSHTQDWKDLVKSGHKIIKETTDMIAIGLSKTKNCFMTTTGGWFCADGHNSLIEFVKNVRHLLCTINYFTTRVYFSMTTI